jgi:hypothetical protein
MLKLTGMSRALRKNSKTLVAHGDSWMNTDFGGGREGYRIA